MKAVKGNHILDVTEKAYRVIYKDLGYSPLEDNAQEENDNVEGFIPTEDDNTDEVEIEEKDFIFKVGIDDISKDKIIEILKRKGIDHNPRDKKEVLYNLMIEGE